MDLLAFPETRESTESQDFPETTEILAAQEEGERQDPTASPETTEIWEIPDCQLPSKVLSPATQGRWETQDPQDPEDHPDCLEKTDQEDRPETQDLKDIPDTQEELDSLDNPEIRDHLATREKTGSVPPTAPTTAVYSLWSRTIMWTITGAAVSKNDIRRPLIKIDI